MAWGKKQTKENEFRSRARVYLAEDPTAARVRKELRKLETEAFEFRHGKDDFYRYLEGVYEAYLYWRGRNQLTSRCAELAKQQNIRRRKNHTNMHLLVEATSEQTVRMRNRWVQGLRYLVIKRSKVEQRGFKRFCKDNGGIAGCADLMAAHKRATAHSSKL